jgi:hypothetical protein
MQYLFGDAKICAALFSARFFIFFSVTPMDLCYLYKLQIFILYLYKNITNIRDTCLRGAEKFAKLLLFLLIDFVFCYFERLFESQDDSF